jgi:hypothetical protein
MVEFPSFGGWLSKQSLFFRVNFNGFMKMSPLFIFGYGFAICKSMGMTPEMSYVVPGMVSAGVFVLFLSWDYGNRNQSTAFLPLNVTLVWDAASIKEEVTNIVQYVPLKEDPVKKEFIYGVKFDMPLEDDKKEKFQHAIFIAQHPMDKTFRRIPGQFVAYGGSVFEGMAARIVCTYANEYQDLRGYSKEDMVMGNWKIFHVKWCLEDSKTDQVKLGLYAENGISRERVGEAVQLEIDRKATRIGMALRESEGQLRSFAESYKDAETRGDEIVNYLIDDQERIKKERSLMTRLMKDKWVRYLLIIIAAGVIAYALRYYKVI